MLDVGMVSSVDRLPPRPRSSRGPAGRLGAWAALLLVGLGAGLSPACTLSLDDDIACGDGYVDLEAGEECDPGDPDSFVHACADTLRPYGTAACDPTDCTIIDDPEQCRVCGDGIIDYDAGEECDGNERTCPWGVGTAPCTAQCRFDTSACGTCGNGVLDEGEECDPNLDDQLTMGKPSCAQLSSPLGASRPYTGGQPGSCRPNCLWDRTSCNYCGNGHVDRDVQLDFEGVVRVDEWCDGNAFDVTKLDKELEGTVCSQVDDDLRPIVECGDDCQEFIPLELPQPCCLKTGSACPAPDAPVRCCFEVDDPESPLDPCQRIAGGMFDACR